MTVKKLTTTVDLFSRHAASLASTINNDCKEVSIYFCDMTAMDRRINPKSILGLLSLSCKKGTEIQIMISGPNESVENDAYLIIEKWFDENAEGAY